MYGGAGGGTPAGKRSGVKAQVKPIPSVRPFGRTMLPVLWMQHLSQRTMVARVTVTGSPSKGSILHCFAATARQPAIADARNQPALALARPSTKAPLLILAFVVAVEVTVPGKLSADCNRAR